MMKKKVSVELWMNAKELTDELANKFVHRFGFEIVSTYPKTGSIFGYLEEKHFDNVERWLAVAGVFETEKFPMEKLLNKEQFIEITNGTLVTEK